MHKGETLKANRYLLELQISQKQYCCPDRQLHLRARNLAALGSFWPGVHGIKAMWSSEVHAHCTHTTPPTPHSREQSPYSPRLPGIGMPEFPSPEQAIFWSRTGLFPSVLLSAELTPPIHSLFLGVCTRRLTGRSLSGWEAVGRREA